MKAVQSDQRRKYQQARFRPLYFGMHKVFCSSITVRKEEPSIANIIKHYWCVWKKIKKMIKKKKKKKKNHQKMATNEKKSALSSRHCTMSQDVISQLQQWQKYMNCTSDCFCIDPILQIWPPMTTSCLQTSKECSRERDLALMKKWYRKLKHILRPKTLFYKKGIELLEKHWNQCITRGNYVDE